MWGVDIEEFKKNPDIFLNDFLRDDEVLAIDTKDRTLVIMTMRNYTTTKAKALAKGFLIGEANITMLNNENL